MKKKMTIKQAFLQSYDDNASNILRYIFFRVNNQQLAEDLLQETFLKSWQYITEGNEVKNLKGFLYKIANNLVIDHWRQKPKSSVYLEDLNFELKEDSNEELRLDWLMDKEKIEKALKGMSDDYRQILTLRYVNDLSIKEISEIIDKSPNNISVMIHRAIKMLKNKIKND